MKRTIPIILVFLTLILIPQKSCAFVRITDLVLGDKSVSAKEIPNILNTIKNNKIANKKIKGKRNKLPTQLTIIEARQANPLNIQFEINTSEVVTKSSEDVQLPISNTAFLNSIQEALMLFEDINIATIMFAPLKLTSAQADTEDGINVITFRASQPPDGVPAQTSIFTIVNYSRGSNIVFMNEALMVKPGTILDADCIFDPSNDPCLAFFTTEGAFKIGGVSNPIIKEGGFDAKIAGKNCSGKLGVGEIVEFAVKGISRTLGLEPSAIVTDANSRVPTDMVRYSLTNDDKIGLANIYPNTPVLQATSGTLSGKVILNGNPVLGAHVVLEDITTGEPVAGTITNLFGQYEINAVPQGSYTVYAEPLDSASKKPDFVLNSFANNAQIGFTTTVLPTSTIITPTKKTTANIEVKENPDTAFNINSQTLSFTETDYLASGQGTSLLPIKIMTGETKKGVLLWGDNITVNFGTLSVSGSGITISNAIDQHIPITPIVECADCTDSETHICKKDPRCPASQELTKEGDQIPGIKFDITCAPGTPSGPRTIIFTGDKLTPNHPSFGLRDQITGGIIVTEE